MQERSFECRMAGACCGVTASYPLSPGSSILTLHSVRFKIAGKDYEARQNNVDELKRGYDRSLRRDANGRRLDNYCAANADGLGEDNWSVPYRWVNRFCCYDSK